MAKGFFSQGVAVLFEGPPELDALAAALGPREIHSRNNQSTSWAFGGPTLLLPFRPEVNGHIAVDVVPMPWPDTMGDPKNDSSVFGAWAMGHFGPCTYPGNLTRASQQSWHWKEATAHVARHAAFVRIRCSYVFGVEKDAPVMPKDYQPVPELVFVTEISAALLAVPGALCYFNPGGEMLCPQSLVAASLTRHHSTGPMAVDLWSNVRMFQLPHDAQWLLMDTVGMEQLDVTDHEAAFPRAQYEPGAVAGFLRNAADYVIDNGPVIKDGDTMDGPGGVRWQAVSFENSIAGPPRAVLRWLPMDGSARPVGIEGES
jgi:hypothetical protein